MRRRVLLFLVVSGCSVAPAQFFVGYERAREPHAEDMDWAVGMYKTDHLKVCISKAPIKLRVAAYEQWRAIKLKSAQRSLPPPSSVEIIQHIEKGTYLAFVNREKVCLITHSDRLTDGQTLSFYTRKTEEIYTYNTVMGAKSRVPVFCTTSPPPVPELPDVTREAFIQFLHRGGQVELRRSIKIRCAECKGNIGGKVSHCRFCGDARYIFKDVSFYFEWEPKP